MDRLFLSQKNLGVIYKYTSQGLEKQLGTDLNSLAGTEQAIKGFKQGIAQIMKKVYDSTPKPQGKSQREYLLQLNQTAISSSVNQIIAELQRRTQSQQSPLQPQQPPIQHQQPMIQPQPPMQTQQPMIQPQPPLLRPQQPPSSEQFIERNFISPPPSQDSVEPPPTSVSFSDLDSDTYNRMNADKSDLNSVLKQMEADRSQMILPPSSNINFAEQERLKNEKLLREAKEKKNEQSQSEQPRNEHKSLSTSDIDAALAEMMGGGNSSNEIGNFNDDDLFSASFEELTPKPTSTPSPVAVPSGVSPVSIPEENYKIINIDSTELVGGDTYRLESAIPNIKAVQLLSAEIPVSGYLINRYNNTIYWKESAHEVKKGIITPGNYTIEQLVETIQNIMNEQGNGNYKVKVDPITEKVTIASNPDSKHKIQLFEVQFTKEYSIGLVLGFEKKDYSGNLDYTSEKRYNLHPPNYLNLSIAELSENFIQKVQLGSVNNVVYHRSKLENREDRVKIKEARTVSSLRIEWRMPNKRQYLFEGGEWSISLCLIH